MTAQGRAVAAELVGTAALLAAIVGSGIMAERLSPTSAAVALLANALTTGLALYVIISAAAPISGAHLNPLVTLGEALAGRLRPTAAAWYGFAQLTGSVLGVWLAHAMFELPILELGTKARLGYGTWLGEAVATAGLLATIVAFRRLDSPAAGVACYITAAYWFTSSTSFTNPAVTVARSLTDTFAGIRPSDVAGFVSAQAAGFAAVLLAMRAFGTGPIGDPER